MSSSAINNNNNNQAAANPPPVNPFSDWKSTVDLNKNKTVVSNLYNGLATLILSYLPIPRLRTIVEYTQTQLDPDNVYRGIMGDVTCVEHTEHAKSSYTGKELSTFQRLLSLKGQDLINGQPPVIKSWAELLAGNEMSLTRLKNLDLSDVTNMTDLDVIALTKSSPNLTTLILPGAFPSDEVMAVLRANCPQVVIYPSAMTEHEWAHPAEFMAKLPPPPQAITDFINSPRPIWLGKTSAEAHMVMPRVNKIVRNIDGQPVMVPWTLKNIDELDTAAGRVRCRYIWDEIIKSGVDTPSEVGFEWVVFTKDILPRTRYLPHMHNLPQFPNQHNDAYGEGKQAVEHWGYEVPGFIDVVTCMLWQNRISGIRIYNDNNRWLYTLCKERVRDYHLVVGGFTPGGVNVHTSFDFSSNLGVGGIRKFKG